MEKADIKETLNGNNNEKYITPMTLKKWGGSINDKIDEVSNSKGICTKFSNGTMIYRGYEIISLPITTKMGNLYRSLTHQDTNNFPIPFIEKPFTTFSVMQLPAFVGNYGSSREATNSRIGTFILIAPEQVTSVNDKRVEIICIGKWK